MPVFFTSAAFQKLCEEDAGLEAKSVENIAREMPADFILSRPFCAEYLLDYISGMNDSKRYYRLVDLIQDIDDCISRNKSEEDEKLIRLQRISLRYWDLIIEFHPLEIDELKSERMGAASDREKNQESSCAGTKLRGDSATTGGTTRTSSYPTSSPRAPNERLSSLRATKSTSRTRRSRGSPQDFYLHEFSDVVLRDIKQKCLKIIDEEVLPTFRGSSEHKHMKESWLRSTIVFVEPALSVPGINKQKISSTTRVERAKKYAIAHGYLDPSSPTSDMMGDAKGGSRSLIQELSIPILRFHFLRFSRKHFQEESVKFLIDSECLVSPSSYILGRGSDMSGSQQTKPARWKSHVLSEEISTKNEVNETGDSNFVLAANAKRMLEALVDLRERFVVEGSAMEINLSHRHRSALLKDLRDVEARLKLGFEDISEFQTVLDLTARMLKETRMELVKILSSGSDSLYEKFKSTPMFSAIMEEITIHRRQAIQTKSKLPTIEDRALVQEGSAEIATDDTHGEGEATWTPKH